jgi:hypothetical protein
MLRRHVGFSEVVHDGGAVNRGSLEVNDRHHSLGTNFAVFAKETQDLR